MLGGEEGARLALYAGQPQGDAIVLYGPFIGDSKEDIVRLFTEYQAGQFVRMTSKLAASRQREHCSDKEQLSGNKQCTNRGFEAIASPLVRKHQHQFLRFWFHGAQH